MNKKPSSFVILSRSFLIIGIVSLILTIINSFTLLTLDEIRYHIAFIPLSQLLIALLCLLMFLFLALDDIFSLRNLKVNIYVSIALVILSIINLVFKIVLIEPTNDFYFMFISLGTISLCGGISLLITFIVESYNNKINEKNNSNSK